MKALSIAKYAQAAAVLLTTAVLAEAAHAGVVTYTDSAAFQAAISGYSTAAEDYGAFSAGTPISAGNTFHGLTYSTFTPGPDGSLQGGIITDQFNSFTGLSLGGRQSTGDQFFYGGDSVTITLANPVNAFGMFFNANTGSGNYGFTTSLGTATTGSSVWDTDTFVFAGLVSTDVTFTSVTFTSSDVNLGSYNVPKILMATAPATVPEPSTLVLSGCAAAVLVACRLRRRRPARIDG